MTEFLTAHQSLEVLVREKPTRYVRGGIAQIVRGAASAAVGASLTAVTLYALADQHEIFAGITDPIGEFVDNIIPGDTSYVGIAREKADWLLNSSGYINVIKSVAVVGTAAFGIYTSIKRGIRQLGDGFTSLLDSRYEHFDDGRTWQ